MSEPALIDAYDAALFDLDGVIYLGPEPVPAYLVGAVEIVVHGVEEMLRVGAPGTPVIAAGDPVTEVLAGVQVAEAELEDLVAVGVDAVGEQTLVGTDRGDPEVEVSGAPVLRVDVEEER